MGRFLNHLFFMLCAGVLFTASVGCGSEGADDESSDADGTSSTGSSDVLSTDVELKTYLAEEGGLQGMRLEFESGAYLGTEDIEMAVAKSHLALAQELSPETVSSLGPAADFSPDGATFEPPATLYLPFSSKSFDKAVADYAYLTHIAVVAINDNSEVGMEVGPVGYVSMEVGPVGKNFKGSELAGNWFGSIYVIENVPGAEHDLLAVISVSHFTVFEVLALKLGVAECDDQQQCGNAEVCVSGVCKKKVCDPNLNYCNTSTSHAQCNADGDTYLEGTLESCANGSQCVISEGNQAACSFVGCKPECVNWDEAVAMADNSCGGHCYSATYDYISNGKADLYTDFMTCATTPDANTKCDGKIAVTCIEATDQNVGAISVTDCGAQSLSCAVVSEPPPAYATCDICTPVCDGKECGEDGCGGECGTCPADTNMQCNANGQCEVVCQDNQVLVDSVCKTPCGDTIKCQDSQVCQSGYCEKDCLKGAYSNVCLGNTVAACCDDGSGCFVGTQYDCVNGQVCTNGVCALACGPENTNLNPESASTLPSGNQVDFPFCPYAIGAERWFKFKKSDGGYFTVKVLYPKSGGLKALAFDSSILTNKNAPSIGELLPDSSPDPNKKMLWLSQSGGAEIYYIKVIAKDPGNQNTDNWKFSIMVTY